MSNFGVNQLAQGHIPLIHLTGRTIRGKHIQKDTCLLQATEKRLGVSQKSNSPGPAKENQGFQWEPELHFFCTKPRFRKKKEKENEKQLWQGWQGWLGVQGSRCSKGAQNTKQGANVAAGRGTAAESRASPLAGTAARGAAPGTAREGPECIAPRLSPMVGSFLVACTQVNEGLKETTHDSGACRFRCPKQIDMSKQKRDNQIVVFVWFPFQLTFEEHPQKHKPHKTQTHMLLFAGLLLHIMASQQVHVNL